MISDPKPLVRRPNLHPYQCMSIHKLRFVLSPRKKKTLSNLPITAVYFVRRTPFPSVPRIFLVPAACCFDTTPAVKGAHLLAWKERFLRDSLFFFCFFANLSARSFSLAVHFRNEIPFDT